MLGNRELSLELPQKSGLGAFSCLIIYVGGQAHYSTVVKQVDLGCIRKTDDHEPGNKL